MAKVEPRMMEGIIRQRMSDMSLVLDHLSDIESQTPALAGKIDYETFVAAGHSMGAATIAQVSVICLLACFFFFEILRRAAVDRPSGRPPTLTLRW